MSEHEPHVPDKPSTPGAQQGSDPAAPQPPTEPAAPEPPAQPAGTPPGSPLAPPPGAPAPPAPGSPDAPAPGPMQTPGYPTAGYPQQQSVYQQPGYPPSNQGYLSQAPGYGAPNAGYPQPQPGYPQQQGYPQPSQPQYPPSGYAARPPAPRRPPLEPRQKRGAMIAGAVSFTIMTFGFGLVAAVAGIIAISAFIGTIFTWIASSNPQDFSAGELAGTQVVDQWIADAWSRYGVWLIAAAVLGIIIWILGYLSSIWILRGHKVNRPTAVTWSGLGIAVVANVIVGTVTTPFANLTGMFTPSMNGPDGRGPDGLDGLEALNDIDFSPFIAFVIIAAIVGLLVNAAIGLLSWWWMAHALRARPAAGPGAQDHTPPTAPSGVQPPAPPLA
ncbi:MAG: hypothetical protein ABWX65_05880 [Mycetocola sp.]